MRIQNQLRVFSLILACFLTSTEGQTQFSAEFGISPDNALTLVQKHLASARISIDLNLYQFDQEILVDLLKQKIDAGVRVRLLLEGEPLGGISAAGYEALRKLLSAVERSPRGFSAIRLMAKPADKKSKRRYRYDHAKYALIDQEKILISSENFTRSGQPTVGLVGNRGWTAEFSDPKSMRELQQIFDSDWNSQTGDTRPLTWQDLPLRSPSESDPAAVPLARRTQPAIPVSEGAIDSATLIASPNAFGSLKELFESAKKSLEIETMSLPSTPWKKQESEGGISPLVQSLVAQSRRGVQVRVLLNDERVFFESSGGSADRNRETITLLNRAAACDHLPLEARTAQVKALQISAVHNKGVLIDQNQVLVSSINGTQNSVESNRELAALLTGAAAYKTYGRAFELDWVLSSTPMVKSEDEAGGFLNGFEFTLLEDLFFSPDDCHSVRSRL